MNNGWPKLGGLLGIAYCVAGFFLIFLGWNGAASQLLAERRSRT